MNAIGQSTEKEKMNAQEAPLPSQPDVRTPLAGGALTHANGKAYLKIERYEDPVDFSGDSVHPSTYGQQQLWFLHHLDKNDDTYHKPMSIRLHGKLNGAALERALRSLVTAHETLRSTFFESHGELFVRVCEDKTVLLEKPDLGAYPPEEKDMAVRRWVSAFISRPFDLERDIPIRCLLVTLSPESHILLLVLHHIQSDGSSYVRLAVQLSDLYNNICRHGIDTPLKLSTKAATWGQEEKEFLKTKEASVLAEYWRDELRDFSSVIAWPAPGGGRNRLEGNRPAGSFSFTPETSLWRLLRHESAGSPGYEFRFLLATYYILLYRLTGAEAITVAVPVHDRRGQEDDDAIGFRMKTLPVTVRMERNLTFSDVLRQVNVRFRAALRHMRLPIGHMLEEMLAGKAARPDRLFHSYFNYKEDFYDFFTFDGLRTEPYPVDPSRPKSDLAVVIGKPGADHDGTVNGILLQYDRDIFSDKQIGELSDRWLAIMRQCAEDPHAPVMSLDILLPTDRKTTAPEPGDTTGNGYPDICLHELFRDQVLTTPDLPALVMPETFMSYAELDRRSDALAAWLQCRGVCGGQPVAVCMVRSADMVVALLAVLKSGGAMLPVDVHTPPERIRYMFKDAAVRICLTDSDDMLPIMAGVRFVPMYLALKEALRDGLGAERSLFATDHLAYVIYTSGTTGAPKGVMIEHRNIVNRLEYTKRILRFSEKDRTLQKSSPGFDVSVPEIFLPLISGGAVVLPGPDRIISPERMAGLIIRHAVTYVHFVPSMLRAFLDIPYNPAVDATLKCIWCGGEAITYDLVEDCLSTYRARLIHGYGPTETAVGVSLWECRTGSGYDRPPIGLPNAHTVIHVMDADGHPVPVGVTGELWIGGAQVGRGYVNDAELTRSRFVESPAFPGGGRFYRSGDLGRYLEDGNLMFMGRLDDQVKVRGQRVEPEEVSSVLRSHEGIRDAVVLSEADGEGSRQLVGYLLSEADHALEAGALLGWLSSLLPMYMIPVRFHVLAAFPLTAHGKVDREALRLTDGSTVLRAALRGPAETFTERVLSQVWSVLLGISAPGVEDNFFSLGGHSLLALRMVAQVRDRLGIQLSLSDIYADARLGRLASRLESLRGQCTALPVDRVAEGVPIPMSAGQRRMWMLQQMLRRPSSYHVTRLLPLPSGTGKPLLQAVLQTLASRHEVLRTRLTVEGDSFLQVIDTVSGWSLPWREAMVDADGLPSLLRSDREVDFLLSEHPLWRVLHVDCGGDCHLFFTFHHAIMDAWSMRMFFVEFWKLLGSGGDAMGAGLRLPAFRYADFALWQSALVRGEEGLRQEAYWRGRLQDLSGVLRLRPDMTVQDTEPGRLGQLSVGIGESLKSALQAYAQTSGVSLFSVFLSVWQVLLYRMTGEKDILIGTPVSQRGMREWQEVMGFFLNMLPVRTTVDGGLSFRAHNRRVWEELGGAFAHADLPYDDILKLAEKGMVHTQDGILQLIFVMLEDASGVSEDIVLPENDISLLSHARHEMACVIDKSNDDWKIRMQYDADRFKEETVWSTLQRFLSFIQKITSDPDTPIPGIDILLPGETGNPLLLKEETNAYAYPECTLHGLFSEKASIHPNDPAVLSDEGTMSYAMLDQRSDRLASKLRDMGVRADSIVGIFMHRSPKLLVSILAVLKAGGAFLPLDVNSPLQRVAFMIRDSGTELILTDRALPESIPDSVKRMVVDEDVFTDRDGACAMVAPVTGASALAYVIYTSGSTGSPKGAMIEHGNIVNRLLHTKGIFGFGRGDHALQKSPLSFDVCMTELFLPLISGGAVVFPGDDAALSPRQIIDLVCRHDIRYLHFVPAMLREFLAEKDVHRVNGHLRIIRCGGESLPVELMADCLSKLSARLFHSYGPAETAVAVTLWECRTGSGYDRPPIGLPNAHTVIHVMDADGHPVPVGVTGELWIGGAQVGRGYVNDAELTRSRFVESPAFPGGGRFYRSGDLGRYLEDGNLMFMGRLDDQVKVRGQRVEPEEVSSVLRSHEGIRDAVVLSEADGEGSRQLVGYLLSEADHALEAGALLGWLSSLLPMYMIPVRFHVLAAFPLTAHGKVDREALRLTDGSTVLRAALRGPAETFTERVLSQVWSVLLGISAPGVEDNFFSLGGHSLLALRMVAQVRDRLGIQLSLSDIYADARLGRLASRLESLRGQCTALPVDRVAEGVPIPMSAGQRRMWMLQQMLRRPSSYHVTRLLPLPSGTGKPLLQAVLQTLASRHEVLRTRLTVEGDSFLQVIDTVSGWSLPWREAMVDADGLPSLLRSDREVDFLLSEHPLWRVLHVDCGGDCHLFFTFHHAIMDAWSMRMFFVEFWKLLGSGGDAMGAGLRLPAFRYADFALWQSALVRGEEGLRQEAYWRGRLQDLSGVLRLRPDMTVQDTEPGRLGQLSVGIGESLKSALQAYAQTSGVSLFSVFLSVWQVLLYRMTGEKDILIGTPVSQRGMREWQEVMGFFLNMLPVRTTVDGGLSFRAHNRRVWEELGGAFAHADLPYSHIAEMAGGVEDIPFNTILQQVFIMLEHEAEAGDHPERFSGGRPLAEYVADDIVFLADTAGGDWGFIIRFDASRYGGRRMGRLLEAYILLLGQFAADADLVIDAAGLLTETERSRVLEIGRGEAHDLPEDPCIHAMFRAQAMRTPARIALECNGRSMTYHDLHMESNRISRVLSNACGIRPGDVVALVMPQGDRLVSMILAVLATGAAVLPVDPALPVMRIRYMLLDSGSSHVVVSEENADLVPSGIKRIDADIQADDLIDDDPVVATDAQSRAYCMYTSGSTGDPKGTFNRHIGFTNMVLSHVRTMGITEDDRVVQFATPSFDVSLFEMFIALYTGATLVIPGKIDLSVLPSYIVEKRVSVAMMTPMVIGTLEADALFPLRVLMTGGEDARPSDAMRLADRLAFYNTYGPTEVSVWSTIHRIRSGQEGRKIPIGRPVQNTSLYILDPQMNLLPHGLTGELYIGGAGVGLGYHGKDDLTAERFIPDPFEPGQRLYKTGDLAYWNEDGDLCFIGRKDTQVKVMGYRIELGEINAAMERLPTVLQAEVIPRRRSGMESMLVAFVVTEGDREIDDIAMRDRLSQSLPVYMLPVRFHRICRMPLTHNGKVDRNALEKIDEEKILHQEKELTSTGIRLPKTPTERDLATIWAALLGTGVIGTNDNFFSLGGNSLQLIRLMLLINERWGITSDISRIYTHLTLRAMAILIEEQKKASIAGDGMQSVLLPIPAWDPLNGWPVYVMVGGAGSPEEFTKYHRIGEHVGEDFKLLIMPDPAGMQSLFPRMPVGELAAKYARMILARQPEGPYILMGDCIGGIDAYATACEIERMTGAKVRVIMMDTAAPLTTGDRDATPHGLLQYYDRFTETPASNEWSFQLFLRALKIPGFRKLFHRTPESRKQAERLAIAYGLFDPEWYRKTYLSASDTAEDPFAHYIREGWKQHFIPSPRFNPYRYKKNNDGFSISDDNPVLHALFIGMHQRYVRSRIDHGRRSRTRRSDIMSARTFLRREQFHPAKFGGDVDLIVSAKIHARNPMMGWDQFVSGRLRSHRTVGDHRSYLQEQLSATAALLSRILGVKRQPA